MVLLLNHDFFSLRLRLPTLFYATPKGVDRKIAGEWANGKTKTEK